MKPIHIITLAAMALAALTGAPATWADDGAALYAKQCAACHGPKGAADTKPAQALGIKPFAGNADVTGKSVADLKAALEANDKHKAALKALSGDQLELVLEHVKALAAGS